MNINSFIQHKRIQGNLQAVAAKNTKKVKTPEEIEAAEKKKADKAKAKEAAKKVAAKKTAKKAAPKKAAKKATKKTK